MDTLSRILLRHALEITNECLRAVGYVRIVLDIRVTDVLADGLGRPALVEHQIVESRSVLLVAFALIIHGTICSSCRDAEEAARGPGGYP